MTSSAQLRVTTYNIHRSRGLDGRSRLERIIGVLEEVDADIVALQEVLAPQAAKLAAALGMHVVFGATRLHARHPYGNLCLSRLPVVGHATYSLTCRPFEPRGCLRADVDSGRGQLHVFNVHLGLHYGERVRQVRMLSRIIDRRRLRGPRLLVGDFNEWFDGHASRLLGDEFGHAPGRGSRARTHPSLFPMFPLDRIYHDPAVKVERIAVHRSRLARVASDHLPAYADLRLEPSRA